MNCVKEQLPFQSQVNIVQNRQYVTLDKHATLKELLENLDFDEDCPNSEYYTPSEFSQLNLTQICLFI